MLPGFFNSFADTPTKSASQRAKEKGKARLQQFTLIDDDGQSFFAPQAAPFSPPSSPLGPISIDLEDHPMEDAVEPPLVTPVLEQEEADQSHIIELDGDIKMDDDALAAQQEVEMEIEPPNWRDEVCLFHYNPDSILTALISSIVSYSLILHQTKVYQLFKHCLTTLWQALPWKYSKHTHRGVQGSSSNLALSRILSTGNLTYINSQQDSPIWLGA